MPGSERVQSVNRALELLERVARSDGGMTVRELSEATNLKRPTVNNLVLTLVDRGYLTGRGSPARYSLGPIVEDLAPRNGDDRPAGRGRRA
ncbi:MAG: helix-turn-helix domain-containing protein [Phycisphaeraceae bacterium]